MKFPRLLGWFLIVGAVLTGIFIIGLKVAPIGISNRNSLTEETKTPVNELPRVESLESAAAISLPELNTAPNLTQEIAKKISQTLLQKNPDGPSLLEGRQTLTALEPETLINELLARELENFDALELQPKVDWNRIKIASKTNSFGAGGYFSALNAVWQKYFSGLGINASDLKPQNLSLLKEAAEKIINDLYELRVSEEFLTTHVKELTLAVAFKNIFGMLEQAESDPFGALVALQFLNQVNREFLALNQDLEKSARPSGP